MEHTRGIFHMIRKIIFLMACLVVTSSPSSTERQDNHRGGLDSKQGGKLSIQASCLDYPSCELDLDLLKRALETRRMDEACGHARVSFQCQRSATKLCEKEGVVNAEALNKMTRAYIYTEIYVQEMCHQGSSPDNHVSKGGSHCSEFRSCFSEVKRYKEAAHSEMYYEACSIASRIYQCSKSAILDCRTRQSLSQEALDLMEDTTLQAGLRVDTICTFTTTTVPPSRHVTNQCFDYASCPKPDLDILQLAKRTGIFDDACRTMVPYAQCLRQTVKDCEVKHLVSGITLLSMKESLGKANKDIKMYCPLYESNVVIGRFVLSAQDSEKGLAATFDLRTTPPPTTCLDIGSCPRPHHTRAGKSYQRDYRLACQSMKTHTSCIGQATDDCKIRKLITGSALDAMVRNVQEAKKVTEYVCNKATGLNQDNDELPNTAYRAHPSFHCYVISIVSTWLLGVSFLSLFYP